MKILKPAIAFVLSLILVLSLCTAASAATIISYGDYSYTANGDGAYLLYKYNGSDKNLQLPDNIVGLPVIGIYDNCFKNSDIESVAIPSTYTSIGKSAFYNCSSLSSIEIPDSIVSIGEMAFVDCVNLTSVEFTGSTSIKVIPYAAFKGDTNLTAFTIPDSVTSISSYAFAETGITSITVPDSVTSTGTNVFASCGSLSDIELSKNITEITDYMFYNCSVLETIALPAGLTAIGDRAFSGCTSLTGVDLPTKLESIGRYGFYNATSLGELFIPDSVTSIGADAFSPMSYLSTINISYYSGSYAQTYCSENYVKKTTVLQKLKGDVNLDGNVNIRDVTTIQLFLVGLDELSYRAVELAEVTGDGKLSIRDATKIQMYLVDMISEL